MTDHVRKVNDELPPLDCTLKDKDGAFDYSGYTLRFVMRSSGNDVIADASTDDDLTALDTTAGRVRMNFSSSHVGTIGNYLAEFELASSGKHITFPNGKDVSIVLIPELSTN